MMMAMLAGVLFLVAQTAFPDLTITTRTTFKVGDSSVQTKTLQLKGQRQRFTEAMEIGGRNQSGVWGSIDQCDLHREILLNQASRIYGIIPFRDDRPVTLPRRAAIQAFADTRPVTEILTIDAVDTGERREIGQLKARHVITTWTTEAADSARTTTRVQDGWYIDVSFGCQSGGAMAFAMLNQTTGRTEVRWRGRARTGYAIEETDRTTSFANVEGRTELVAVSDARLPDALFEIPDGYRPALPTFVGGFDMRRPDTYYNRAVMTWETARNWMRQWQWWR